MFDSDQNSSFGNRTQTKFRPTLTVKCTCKLIKVLQGTYVSMDRPKMVQLRAKLCSSETDY